MRAVPMFFFALVCGLAAVPAAGQHVRGGVFEQDGGRPIHGAMVVLLDEAGNARASGLTNEAGRYLLSAAAPGRYSVLVQRIGFTDVFTPLFDLAAGQTVQRDVLASAQAIVLEGITAEARRRCVIRPQEGLAIATLWAEARKALEATAFTEQQQRYRFRVKHFRRDLDAVSLRVLAEESRVQTGYSDRSPFASLPAEQLLRDGFIHVSDTATIYQAPDAHVLLSDSFLDEYCFRLADPEDGEDGLIGLGFEPGRRQGPPAVRGTLWLDRATFELRHIEYGYTRIRMPEGPSRRIGGRVEFEALPNGTWIVRRWGIRMPQIEERPTPWRPPNQRMTRMIVGLTEVGGEILDVTERGAGLSIRVGAASVSGTVYDSAASVPLAGATVHLLDTDYRGVTDDDGVFRIDNVGAGEYRVAFMHPRTDLYGFSPVPERVAVRAGADTALSLAIPASVRGTGLPARCPADAQPAAPAPGVIHGRVIDEVTGEPHGGVQVSVSGLAADGAPLTRTAVTTADGRYIVCGVPERGPLTTRVVLGDRGTEYTGMDGPGSAGFVEYELQLSVTDPPRVIVKVHELDSGRPIADATITLTGRDLRAVTNRHGRASFAALEAGTHELRIEHAAYGTHTHEFTLGGTPATVEVRVPAAAAASTR